MAFGARFLKRLIDERIKLPISARWREGSHFHVKVVRADEITIEVDRRPSWSACRRDERLTATSPDAQLPRESRPARVLVSAYQRERSRSVVDHVLSRFRLFAPINPYRSCSILHHPLHFLAVGDRRVLLLVEPLRSAGPSTGTPDRGIS